MGTSLYSRSTRCCKKKKKKAQKGTRTSSCLCYILVRPQTSILLYGNVLMTVETRTLM